ncbi:MAG: serine/threonine protein kinase [Candidatus Promineifilaceae bacterium]|jgi:serine/threonine protein kinase
MADEETQIQLDRIDVFECSECNTALDVSDLEPFTEVECPNCEKRDNVPAKLGQFTLLNLINTGGMGAVYRGRDDSLGRLVAIKVMLKRLGEDPKVVEDFQREAQAAARLNHPNVAQIYSFGQEHSQPYIVMELVSGKRFDKMIDRGVPLDPAVVMKVAVDIAEGLKAAEAIGLVHGDVKPENILLDESNNAKLVDFGIASFADQAQPEGGIWGTPYYIAPEKVTQKKSDTRSDIYSLGASLYHALSAKPPFEGKTPIDVVRARLDCSPPPLDLGNKAIPKGISEVVARMLEREPSRRHPTYASLISDLRREYDSIAKSRTGHFNTGAVGKRIRIKKSSSSASTPTVAADASRPTAGPVRRTVKLAKRSSPGRVAVTTITQKTPEQLKLERKTRRKARVMQATIFGIILFLLGGGGVALMVKKNHDKNLAERSRANRVRIASEECEQLLSKVSALNGVIASTAKRVEPLIKVIEEAVLFVEGKPLKSFYPADQFIKNEVLSLKEDDGGDDVAAPEAEGELSADPSAPTVDENGREAPFDAEGRRPAAPAKPQGDAPKAVPSDAPAAKRTANVDEHGREAPFDAEARPAAPAEESAVASAPASEKAPADAEDVDDASADTNVVDVAEAFIEKITKVRDPIDGPEVVVLADQVVIFSERITVRLNEVNARALSADQMWGVAEDARDPAVAEAQIAGIQEHLDFVTRSKEEVSEWLDEAKELTTKVSQARAVITAQRERAADLAEQQAEAERYAEKVKNERELVSTLAEDGAQLIVQHNLDQPVSDAEALLLDLETPEAKADLDVVLGRFRIIQGVRLYLIAQIKKQPYRWGWRPHGGQGQDIVAANAEGITTSSQKIPWNAISLPLLSKILDHYVGGTGVPPSAKANNLIGLAFLCRLNSREAAAEQFESRATMASPYAQATIERLKP